MEWIAYLPEILFFLAVLVVIYVIFSIAKELWNHSKGRIQCYVCRSSDCKSSGLPRLFLLPLSFGDTYEKPEQYLPTHMTPISQTSQIPTGRRACRIEIFYCSECDTRQVQITDFLLVRGKEYVKEIYVFPYESFQSLLEGPYYTSDITKRFYP